MTTIITTVGVIIFLAALVGGGFYTAHLFIDGPPWFKTWQSCRKTVQLTNATRNYLTVLQQQNIRAMGIDEFASQLGLRSYDHAEKQIMIQTALGMGCTLKRANYDQVIILPTEDQEMLEVKATFVN